MNPVVLDQSPRHQYELILGLIHIQMERPRIIHIQMERLCTYVHRIANIYGSPRSVCYEGLKAVTAQ